MQDSDYARVQEKDEQNKRKMKEYADNKWYVKPSEIKVGETVLVIRPPSLGKQTPYEETPMKVTDKKGTMITAESGERKVTRNSSYFKRFEGKVENDIPVDLDDGDDNCDEPSKIPVNDESVQMKRSEKVIVQNKGNERPKRVIHKPKWMDDYIVSNK